VSEAPAPDEWRRVTDTVSGMTTDAAVYSRASLVPGARLTGPTVIVEPGTSTIVPPGFSLRVDAAGALLIEDTTP
jgi:N-methylhydantoinase A